MNILYMGYSRNEDNDRSKTTEDDSVCRMRKECANLGRCREAIFAPKRKNILLQPNNKPKKYSSSKSRLFVHKKQTNIQSNPTSITAMAQGLAKLTKAKKSAGSKKKQAVRSKTVLKKGRKSFQEKKARHILQSQTEKETTKAINRKNEALIAAKAVSVGTKFFLTDVTQKGQKEHTKQLKERSKKQDRAKSKTEKLKQQLEKLT